MDERELPFGHVEAMRDLSVDYQNVDGDDFQTWMEAFEEKKKKINERKTLSIKAIRSETRRDIKQNELRYEIYNPPEEFVKEAENRGLYFTVGKHYPIYAEVPDRFGMRYITQDDRGARRSVNSVHFTTEYITQWRQEQKWLQLERHLDLMEEHLSTVDRVIEIDDNW